MRRILSLPDEVWERLPAYRAKWQNAAHSAVRVGLQDLRSSISDLYEELEVPPPQQFLTVASPDEAMQTYGEWKQDTGYHMQFFWSYQLPLCDPQSFWRQFGDKRHLIHFAARRKRSKRGCYGLQAEDSGQPTAILGHALHEEILTQFSVPSPRDHYAQMVDSLWDRHPAVWADLGEICDKEEPECPVDIREFFILAPFAWLCQEVACVDYCHAELGIPRNARLYDTLKTLLKWGSLVFTFEKLCIVCEPPITMGPQIVFADGATYG